MRSSPRRAASPSQASTARSRWSGKREPGRLLDAVVARLRARGAELVGELERYEDSYRLCYVRGPEGIIIELAERIG
jgi:catechol 2,3-dioxygenase-like lactoylglutathione lyase family enzyme